MARPERLPRLDTLAAAARAAAVEALVAAAVADHDRAAFGAAGGVALDSEGRGAGRAKVGRHGLDREPIPIRVAVRMTVAVGMAVRVPVRRDLDDRQRG